MMCDPDCCPMIEGSVYHGLTGPCPSLESATEPSPSAFDYCASVGHVAYGRDDVEGVVVDRCYCGHEVYPVGPMGEER